MGSTWEAVTPRASSVRLPSSRHPVMLRSRQGREASASSRSGSPAGSADARASNLVARVARRISAVGRPASAMRAWVGADLGHPVTARAAARISRSTSSRWERDAAGSHAAAAYSMAPRT